MKQYYLLFTMLFLAFACAEEATIEPQITDLQPSDEGLVSLVQLVGDHLKVASVSDWEQLMGTSDESKRTALLAYLESQSFDSYVKTKEARQLQAKGEGQEANRYDAFFFSLLNPDGVIEIGGYLFKVDLPAEQALAIPASRSDLIAALTAGEAAHPEIWVFGMEDNVFDILAGVSDRTAGWCDGTTYGLFKADVYEDRRQCVLEANYFNGIIYREINVKLIHRQYYLSKGRWITGGMVDMVIDWNLEFVVDCNTTVYRHCFPLPSEESTDELVDIVYRSTKKISSVTTRKLRGYFTPSDGIQREIRIE